MPAARAQHRAPPTPADSGRGRPQAVGSSIRRGRTLPLRVAPIDGEALDSWLDALAYRHHMPRRAILEHFAIASAVRCGAWMRLLSADQIDRIADGTGCDPALIERLALPRAGSADGPLSNTRTLPSSTWDWRAHSRWCPHCLTDTGGRWQLAWRLNWTFACLTHRTLLHDSCAKCYAPQRNRSPTYDIPELGRCTEPARDPLGRQRRCGMDLGRMQDAVPLSWSMARTQLLINVLLEGQPSELRLYGSHQTAPIDILNDLRTIARYVFTLLAVFPADSPLPTDMVAFVGHYDAATQTNRRTNPSALNTATASTIATAILDAHDSAAAQDLLTLVILATTNVGAPRLYDHEALTPLVRLICQRASEDARTTHKLRRRFGATAAKSAYSREKSRLAGAAAQIDFASYQSGTRWCR
jgi:hypothetical protein